MALAKPTYYRFKPTESYKYEFFLHLRNIGIDEGNAELIAGVLNRNLQFDLYSRASDIIALYTIDYEDIPPGRQFWRLYYHSLKEHEDSSYSPPAFIYAPDAELPMIQGARNVSA